LDARHVTRWFLSRAIPIRNESGQVVRWFGTNSDISEQRAAEEALRVSEARLRQLADAMPQLVWTARPDGRIDCYNQRVEEYSGFGRGDDGTVTWEGAVHAEDLEATLEAWQRAVQDAA
jgi:PAS domain-containing protein